MLDKTSIKVTGSPTVSSWVQVHELETEIPEIKKRRGSLLVIVSIMAPGVGIESALLGREILGRLQEEYFKAEGEAFNSLRLTLEKISTEFKDKAQNLNIITSSYVDGVIYSGVLGHGQVAILREGMLAKILIGKAGVVVASGYPQEGDVLTLATQEFFEGLSFGVLKASLESGDIGNIESTLNSMVHSRQESGDIAAGVWVFREVEGEGEVVQPLKEVPSAVLLKGNSLLDRLKAVKERLLKLVPQRKIYVKDEPNEVYESSRKKTTITVGVILLILLLVSIGFGVRQRNARLSKSKYEARLNQAVHDFDESRALLNLNPERSRELFLASRQIADGLKGEGVKDPILEELMEKVAREQGNILKEYQEPAQDFVDLSLLSAGFRGNDLASSGEDVFVLDSVGKKVVQVSIVNKKAEVVAGPEETESASLISAYEERSFVLTPEGVKELGDKNAYVVDKDWEDALVYAYAGNLYILDKNSSQVSRYPGIDAGFASKQSWLGAGVSPDFTGAASLAIDGSVWVLLSGGRILKFTSGSPQTFSISGLDSPLLNPVNLYTNENLESIYILDSQNARIVVVDKKGEYKAQYVSDDLKKALDLVVSEENKRAVFLLDGNLKSIELKHL